MNDDYCAHGINLSVTISSLIVARIVWELNRLFSLQALDYSDDEKEQEAKRKLKNSRKKKDSSNKGV